MTAEQLKTIQTAIADLLAQKEAIARHRADLEHERQLVASDGYEQVTFFLNATRGGVCAMQRIDRDGKRKDITFADQATYGNILAALGQFGTATVAVVDGLADGLAVQEQALKDEMQAILLQ